jgi:hypothetical protein
MMSPIDPKATFDPPVFDGLIGDCEPRAGVDDRCLDDSRVDDEFELGRWTGRSAGWSLEDVAGIGFVGTVRPSD